MTIQLLHYYNGQAPGVYTLAGAEETRLIGLGLARAYTPGMDGSDPRLSDADVLAVQALVSPDGKPRCVALLGDSTAAQSTLVSGASVLMQGRGSINWMFSYLGHPWDFQATDNFGVGGYTLIDVLATSLPLLLTAHATRQYERVFVMVGTNDTSSGHGLDDIKTRFLTLFRALRAVNIIPVSIGIRPRGRDGAVTVAKQKNIDLNNWLYLQSLVGLIEYIDVDEVYADTTTANGNAVATTMYDGGTIALHPSAFGSRLEGRVMADYYTARGIGRGIKFASQWADIFDRTNNPSGVVFDNANPLIIGGTTAPVAFTATGGTWTNVPRNLPNGQVRADRSCALAASTTHTFYCQAASTGAWAATKIQPGDIIEARALLVMTGLVNVTGVTLRMTEFNGATSSTNYALGIQDDFLLTGDHVLYLKTPRIVVRDYAGSGNVSMFAQSEVYTGAAGAGTAVLRQLEVRKVG